MEKGYFAIFRKPNTYAFRFIARSVCDCLVYHINDPVGANDDDFCPLRILANFHFVAAGRSLGRPLQPEIADHLSRRSCRHIHLGTGGIVFDWP